MRGQSGNFATYSRHSAAFFIAIVVATLLASCGLPTAEYLSAPNFFSSGNSLVLVHQFDNIDLSSDYFLGYSIYYRVYESAQGAANGLSDLISLSNNYVNSPSAFISLATSDPYNFNFMAKLDSSTHLISFDQPLIEVTNNSVSSFNLDLNTFLINQDLSYKIVRNLSKLDDYSSRSDFSIKTNYQPSDPDYSNVDTTAPSEVYIVAFAVASGYSKTTFNSIYSSPAFYTTTSDGIILLTLN